VVIGFVKLAAKAFFAALVAALSGLATVLTGGESLSGVTSAQWVVIALAALLAFGGVYRLPIRTA
jgi:hypothetical protein